MIGTKLTETTSGDVYTVAAADGPFWVVQPVEFGPVERLTPADLAARFDVGDRALSDPAQPDEQSGWDALAAANHEGAMRVARSEYGVPAPTPEAALRAGSPKPKPPRKNPAAGDPQRITSAEAKRLGHR